MRILGVCGSLQAASSNLVLLRAAVSAAPPGVTVVIGDFLRDLPPFNPDLESPATIPAVEAWRRALAGCDAVLIASPEYGHGLPGALKNAIDWVIGSGELHRKVVGITAATTIRERGLRGLQALGQTLRAVDAAVVGEAPIPRGPDFDRELRALLAALVERAGEAGSSADRGTV